jgi:tRNA modification GTPase
MIDRNNTEDTIAAISSPIGEGGIGIVRLSGPGARDIADKIFLSKIGKKPSTFKSHTMHYGHIVSTPDPGPRPLEPGTWTLDPKIIDEVLLTVMRAPKTYTKEDIVEINCHGGIQALGDVLDLCIKRGARVAEPGEFTRRAFINGRIDLAQAEAVIDTIRAKTEGSLSVAMSQLEGELSGKINALRDKIIGIASHVEASIDFPEEELDLFTEETLKRVGEALVELKGLIDSSREGMIFRDGILAVICGKPNAGKSSLMNLLLKRDRVIVTPIPGTTRDAVEEMINLKGIPIRLVDTAGIADTKDVIEKEGMRRSKNYLDRSDVALLVLDGSTELDREDLDIIKLVEKKKKVVIINKTDLSPAISAKDVKAYFKDEHIIEISVEKRKNIDVLEKAIVDLVWSGRVHDKEHAIVANTRHKALIEKAYNNMGAVKKAMDKGSWPELVSIDLKEAVFNLGLVVGKSVSDDILNKIFEQFCIGK